MKTIQFGQEHGFYRAANSAQVFSKCFAPGGGEQLENVVPEFSHVGDFGPEVFQLPPPLVHDPPTKSPPPNLSLSLEGHRKLD